jgi:hypothetical protein
MSQSEGTPTTPKRAVSGPLFLLGDQAFKRSAM